MKNIIFKMFISLYKKLGPFSMQQNLILTWQKNMTLPKIWRTLWQRFFPPFFPFYLVAHNQELDSYENILSKLEVLKATSWLASLFIWMLIPTHLTITEHINYLWRSLLWKVIRLHICKVFAKVLGQKGLKQLSL